MSLKQFRSLIFFFTWKTLNLVLLIREEISFFIPYNFITFIFPLIKIISKIRLYEKEKFILLMQQYLLIPLLNLNAYIKILKSYCTNIHIVCRFSKLRDYYLMANYHHKSEYLSNLLWCVSSSCLFKKRDKHIL